METNEIQKEEIKTEDQSVILEEEKLDQLIENAKFEQNLSGAIIAGFVAAIIGAIAWALITAAIKIQIGWMAVGVGFLVGFVVKKIGKGVQSIFGFVGASLALVGCLLGNLLTIVILGAADLEMPFFELLMSLDISTILAIFEETFHPMDILFYGIAVYEGFKFSFTDLEKESLEEVEIEEPKESV